MPHCPLPQLSPRALEHGLMRSDGSRQQSGSHTSRWGSIRREDKPRGPSLSTASFSSSARRRLPLNGRAGESNASCGGLNRSRGNEKQIIGAHPLRPDSSVGYDFNWRIRAANDASSNPSKASENDETARAAIEMLKRSISSFLDKTQTGSGEVTREELHSCVRRSIEQLSASIFDDAGYFLVERSRSLHDLNSSKSLPKISNVLLWETGYSLIRLIQQLSHESQTDCCEFIRFMSAVALGCLSLMNRQLQQHGKDQFSVSNDISDIRLCECASMLLESMGCEGRLSFLDSCDTANDGEMMLCKATLFLCLGKILAISSMNACASHSNLKNSRERRGPLFPWGAEKTVNMILKMALPFLEVSTKRDGTAISFSDKANYGYGAMECLYFLFRDPNWDSSYESITSEQPAQLSKHAAATFAPLIVDVLPDGKESQHVNPLRSRTLSAICSFWELSYELIQKGQRTSDETIDLTIALVMSCKCLAAALNALCALRKSRDQANQDVSKEIDVSTTAHQLQSMIQNEKLKNFRPKFLSLLTLLCFAYPSASASQWHLFLEHSAAKKSSLISILDEGAAALDGGKFQDESWIALPSTLRATSILLTAMPFTLCISGEARPSTRTSGGDFSSRVRSVLANVMNCIFNLMSAIKARICCEWASIENMSCHAPTLDIVMMLVSEVAVKLSTKLPFNGENHVLLRPSSLLVQCAGNIYAKSAKSLASKSSATKAELEHILLNKAVATFSQIIMENLGAVSSTSNVLQVTSCSAPAKKWLSDASSFEFIGLLLTDSCWPSPSSRERMEMLSAVAKSSPWSLVREPFNLASFCEVCVVQCQSRDTNLRILGVELIESFIIGRKACSAECTPKSTVFSVIPQTFCPLLFVALEDHSAAVRTSSVTSLGSLVRSDWIGLFLSDAGNVNASSIDWTPLESILSLCTANLEKIASVRASSCKAIGDISAVCIYRTLCEVGDGTNSAGPFSDEFVISFADKVCKVMAVALSDDVAIVRSMVSTSGLFSSVMPHDVCSSRTLFFPFLLKALFAVGNIALALKKKYNETSWTSFPITRRLFQTVCESIDDGDEKVGRCIMSCFLCQRKNPKNRNFSSPGRSQRHQKH